MIMSELPLVQQQQQQQGFKAEPINRKSKTFENPSTAIEEQTTATTSLE